MGPEGTLQAQPTPPPTFDPALTPPPTPPPPSWTQRHLVAPAYTPASFNTVMYLTCHPDGKKAFDTGAAVPQP